MSKCGGRNAKVARWISLFSPESNYLNRRIKKHAEDAVKQVLPVFFNQAFNLKLLKLILNSLKIVGYFHFYC